MERLRGQSELDLVQDVKDGETAANLIIALVEGLGPRKIPMILEEVRIETGANYHTVKEVVKSLVEDEEIKRTWDDVAIRIPQNED